MKLLTRRQTLLGLSAATLISPPSQGALFTRGGYASAALGFPGQASNPVGFAATPSAAPIEFTALNGGTWPGAFSSLTAWPGGAVNSGTHATSGAGTSGNPYVFAFYDFVNGSGGVIISQANCIFVGCRFQSSDANNYNVHINAIANVNFIYCSVTPPSASFTSPPNGAWPSAGAGLQLTTSSGSYTNSGGFCTPTTSAYQYGFDVAASAGPCQWHYCDCWGHGNCSHQWGTGTVAQLVQNCWIHDNANGNVVPPGGSTNYHQDGVFNGGNNTPCTNITVNHCTIASIGNTNGIAFQSAASPYSNITVNNCYLSGYGNLMDIGHLTSGNNAMTVTNNTFGTDLPWVFGPLYTDFSTQFTHGNAQGNLWAGNKLNVLAGTSTIAGQTFSWTSGQNGQFLLPNATLSTSDW